MKRLTLMFLIVSVVFAILANMALSKILDQDDQIESLKLENQRLKNELKPYKEAESYIRKVNPKAVNRTGQIVNGAKRHNLPLWLVLLGTHAESDFKWDAVGKCGERGPLQIMPGTFREVMPEGDFNNPDDCFEGSLRYLVKCHRKARGHFDLSLAHYNAGLNRKNPLVAARPHVSRCRTIRRRYWEALM